LCQSEKTKSGSIDNFFPAKIAVTRVALAKMSSTSYISSTEETMPATPWEMACSPESPLFWVRSVQVFVFL
jgi:hypothetical protein